MPISPQPVPTEWGFDAVPDHVVVVAGTPMGTFIHFIMPGNIDAFCNALQEQKKKALGQGQLLTVENNLLGPNGEVIPPSPEVQQHVAQQQEPPKPVGPDDHPFIESDTQPALCASCGFAQTDPCHKEVSGD